MPKIETKTSSPYIPCRDNSSYNLINLSLKERIKKIWDSALIHWAAGTFGSFAFAGLSICAITIAAPFSCIGYGIISLISFLYAKHQKNINSLRFWAEESQLFTNFFKYIKNLTKEQAESYSLGQNLYYYHPIRIEGKTLFQGGQPSNSYDHLKVLIDTHNVKLVINLTEEEEDTRTLFSSPITPNQWKSKQVEALRFPVKDFEIPSLDQLIEIVTKINDHLENKEGNVYVHCMSGMGRSSVATLAFLLLKGQTLGDAKETLQKRRCQVRVDKEKMNVLLWTYIMKIKGDSYSLSNEITKRLSQLDQNLTIDQKKKIIRKEYRGIADLENTLSSIKE